MKVEILFVKGYWTLRIQNNTRVYMNQPFTRLIYAIQHAETLGLHVDNIAELPTQLRQVS